MPNPDDYIEGTFDPNNPINQIEVVETEETLYDVIYKLWRENENLKGNIKRQRKEVTELVSQLECMDSNTFAKNRLKNIFHL